MTIQKFEWFGRSPITHLYTLGGTESRQRATRRKARASAAAAVAFNERLSPQPISASAAQSASGQLSCWRQRPQHPVATPRTFRTKQ